MPLFLNIISLYLDALSPITVCFAYTFKMEAFFLVSQVPQQLERCELVNYLIGDRGGGGGVGGEGGGKGRMRKDLEAAFSRSSHSNLRGVGWCIILQVNFPLLFFTISWPLVLLHNMHHLSCYLPQDNPLTTPKDRDHHLPCWRNFLKRG